MTRFYIILLLLWAVAVQKVTAQVLPHTFSIGANLNYQNNSYNNNRVNLTWITLHPDLQYFYKENRAIVGGLIFNRNEHQYLTYSSLDGSENIWQVKWINRGAFVGLRQHHPINDRFHVFTEFGLRYMQEKMRSEHISGSLIPHGSSRDEYSISGYGNLGLIYFINKRFSLESSLVNARIQYRRPVDASDSSKEWGFDLDGANHVSFALRYFFNVGGKEQ